MIVEVAFGKYVNMTNSSVVVLRFAKNGVDMTFDLCKQFC